MNVPCFALDIATEQFAAARACYFRRAFLAGFFGVFFLADFFLADAGAGLVVVFFFDDDPLPPEKIVSQLSEYCFVAPMRTTLMTGLCS
jgi:hypothetical protein